MKSKLLPFDKSLDVTCRNDSCKFYMGIELLADPSGGTIESKRDLAVDFCFRYFT